MSLRSSLAAVAAVLVLVPPSAAVAATAPGPTPSAAEEVATSSVSLLPRDAAPDDPHRGTWFLFTLDPGASGRAVAALTNPGRTPAEVTLDLRELTFSDDGTPRLGSADAGLGAWGAFESTTVEVPPATTVPVAFQVTVPSGTAPGDHLGVAVATTRHELDGTDVIQQVATRVVVTVPGETARSLEITGVELERTRWLVPGPLVARVTVRNTGSIRLAPRVTVADQDAAGSRLLTRASSETYVGEVHLPPLGGVVHVPVVVTDASGVTRRVDESIVVVPWWLVLLAAAAAGAVAVRRRRRDGGHPTAALEADVRRLERLVVDVQRRLDATSTPPLAAEPVLERSQRVNALELSLVRARRSGEWEVFAALALALHELTGDAYAVLAEAAAADTPYRAELERLLADAPAPAPAPAG